jgi:hypothetical protein
MDMMFGTLNVRNVSLYDRFFGNYIKGIIRTLVVDLLGVQ